MQNNEVTIRPLDKDTLLKMASIGMTTNTEEYKINSNDKVFSGKVRTTTEKNLKDFAVKNGLHEDFYITRALENICIELGHPELIVK